MAERGGFEPSVELPPHLISSQAHSSTLSSLQYILYKKLFFLLTQVKYINIVISILNLQGEVHRCIQAVCYGFLVGKFGSVVKCNRFHGLRKVPEHR